MEKKVDIIKWLLSLSRPYFLRLFIIIAIGLIESLVTVGLSLVLKSIIDKATSTGVNVQIIFVYIGMVIISLTLTMVNTLLAVAVNERLAFGFRKKIFQNIVNSCWYEIRKYHTGDLLTRITSDIDIVAEGISVTLPVVIQLILQLLVTFFTLFYFDKYLAVFALLIAPIAALVCMVLGRKLRILHLKVQEAESSYRSFVQESLSNLLVLKAFEQEEISVEKLGKLRKERYKWVLKRNKLSSISSTVLSFSFQIGYIGAFSIGVYRIASNAISYGTMMVFLNLVNRIQGPIISLAQTIPKIVGVFASAERIIELQNIPVENRSKHEFESDKIGINVTNVSFGYEDSPVLENVSLSIEPGEFVAVVGSSGAGKTTLVRLIMSFVNHMAGKIEFIDKSGQSANVNAGMRELIAYVPQGNTLFSGTIRDNLLMGSRYAKEDELEAVLQRASAEFVFQLPQGLDTVIGEHGHGLSEGQAQRISIARALLKGAPIMIFDEATSALDQDTELVIIKNLKKYYSNATCLMITHRKAVLKYCDREIKIRNCSLWMEELGNAL